MAGPLSSPIQRAPLQQASRLRPPMPRGEPRLISTAGLRRYTAARTRFSEISLPRSHWGFNSNMNFELTQEQAMLQDNVARFVSDACGFEARCAAIACGDTGRARWKTIADLGWIAAGLPEDIGGFGSAIEHTLIAEQLGRGLVLEPFLGCAVLGPQLLVSLAPSRARDELI